MAIVTITAQQTFPQVPGYTLTEQLYSGSRTAVYRALQLQAPQQPVVIKVLQQAYPSFSDLVGFRNQYMLTQNLTLPGVVRTLSLEPWQNSYALVMEDFGGVSLQKYAQMCAEKYAEKDLSSKALPLSDCLAIALQIAGTLQGLYRERIVHKDIKPANILIDPDSKQIKLIDFSIASLLPKETQTLQNPNGLEGSLSYLAPEQTGRMNRGIDYRADFYSLGVTLYELLTGELPFTATDPLELVHCHIAKAPVPVDQVDSAIPSMVSAIVLKLMAKNAEDRYQSAVSLKKDLLRCLSQWQENGQIEPFALGANDISDRFFILEKLYGREAEIKSLLAAFERTAQGHSEIMLVAGFSGIGKTAVINEIHKPITRQQGYFIRGKFDQFNRDRPLSAFVQALRDLMGQILSESDGAIAHWRSRILAVVRESAQLLIDVIPELENIIGSQPDAAALSGPSAENRFNRLFQNFIGLFTSIDHPLVIFLDDLQWADTASLQLIKLLMAEQHHLLLLGAYRDNEVSSTHAFIEMVEALKQSAVALSTLTLAPLTRQDTSHLIADTLHCSALRAQPLTDLLRRKTQGNPFFTVQFLKTLYAEGYITFNPDQSHWECDIAQVSALAISDDVVALMVQQLEKLSRETQRVLQLAACIGNRFDLATLTIVCDQGQPKIAKALWQALEAGLIFPTSQTYKLFQSEAELHAETVESLPSESSANSTYRFLHDRVQQAAYSLIPDSDKQVTHLKVGRLLLQNTSPQEREKNLFEIVSQLNMGIPHLSDIAERKELSQLNLEAAQKARSSAAYSASASFLKISIQLLAIADTFADTFAEVAGSSAWETDYAAMLRRYNLLAEASYLSGDFDSASQHIDVIFGCTHTVIDRIDAYETRIQIAVAQTQFQRALDTGLEALALLQIRLNDAPPPALDIERLYHLPSIAYPQAIAALSILSKLWAPAFVTSPELLPKVILTMLNLSVTHGSSATGAFAYALYGMLLCGTVEDIEMGYRFGQLALHTLAQYEDAELRCKVNQLFHAFIRNWKEPAHHGVECLADNVQTGLETGDIEFACYSAINYCDNLCIIGVPLATVYKKQTYYIELTKSVRQEFQHDCALIWGQFVENLMGDAKKPTELVGQRFDEHTQVARLKSAGSFSVLFFLYIAKAILNYVFEDYEGTLAATDSATQYEAAGCGLLPITQLPMYRSLALLALYSDANDEQQLSALAEVSTYQQRLSIWATHAPENFQHKLDLVAAEVARVQGQRVEALDLYERAIAGAKQNNYLHEEAIANELAAKFYLDWGKEKIASVYLQDAYYCYVRWDAKAKTNDLEKRYPRLLQPIFQENSTRRSAMSALTSIANLNKSHHSSTQTLVHTSIHSTIHPSCTHTTSSNVALDFAAVIKTAQSISGTLELDKLMCQIAQIILQNSGGDRCALVLPNQDGVWSVEAAAAIDASDSASDDASELSCTTTSEPLEGNLNVPTKLLNYVKNTQSMVVIDNLKTDLPVLGRYLLHHRPRSVLCLPILNQGHLIGLLYLQNQATSHVFTEDRIFTLYFLCTQAAISLENARLYQAAQAYAQRLEQSQIQTIQSEKMASLGNLVAGVAHEINNPIGFLNGSIKNASTYLQDLLEHLELYQKCYPNAVEAIQENEQEIDLSFLSEDFPKLIQSMKGATNRIKNISTSLRTFSRADTEYKVSASLNEGLDSTLLILKYRIKANEQRPAIEVVTAYGDLPMVECFPGQLNQVFMNLLANAIDVFDEAAQQSSFEALKKQPPQTITVSTVGLTDSLAERNMVEIRIADNGKGMPDEVKEKIFDHLFTTKAVGKGTGLGLAIARQIVTEAHSGLLTVTSELGKGTEFCIRLPISGSTAHG
ncbi:MAG: serine/threonine protein kinase [Phormidesmis priestleyi]|uniref:histidine kinase n=1 Tax=Phormidesmis priestleyi TaxID=268141 RepID=A0A2W4ZJJ5_9CYAN|nr:MAG: serine/threonine protein kinase [Phormidesmis priestleyi]